MPVSGEDDVMMWELASAQRCDKVGIAVQKGNVTVTVDWMPPARVDKLPSGHRQAAV